MAVQYEPEVRNIVCIVITVWMISTVSLYITVWMIRGQYMVLLTHTHFPVIISATVVGIPATLRHVVKRTKGSR